MKHKYQPRFLFTQLSGVSVGIAFSAISIFLIKKINPDLFYRGNSDYIAAIIIGSTAIISLMVAMVIWGRIIVLLKILKKDEAKGYPWSKPWLSGDSKE